MLKRIIILTAAILLLISGGKLYVNTFSDFSMVGLDNMKGFKEDVYRWKLAQLMVENICHQHGLVIPALSDIDVKDAEIIPSEAVPHIQLALEWGLMGNNPQGRFEPFATVGDEEYDCINSRYQELMKRKPTVPFQASVPGRGEENSLFIDKDGDYHIYFYLYDLATGQGLGYNEDQLFYPASFIKVLYMMVLLKQIDADIITSEKEYTLQKEDKYINGTKVAGTGVLQAAPEQTVVTIEKLLNVMIKYSDNVAANIIIDLLGVENINKKAAQWGMDSTSVNRKFYDMNSSLPSNKSTARDLVTIMTKIENRQCLNDQLSQKAIELMETTVHKDRIASGLGENLTAANKTATIGRMAGDMALIYFPEREPLAVCMAVENKNGAIDLRKANYWIIRTTREIVKYYTARPHPKLYINGEIIDTGASLRYIDNSPYLYSEKWSIDNQGIIINNKKYCSLEKLKNTKGCCYDIKPFENNILIYTSRQSEESLVSQKSQRRTEVLL